MARFSSMVIDGAVPARGSWKTRPMSRLRTYSRCLVTSLAAELDLAAVDREGAGDRVEQGRLAGAVGADDGDELARGDVEVDAVERDHLVDRAREEDLAQAGELEICGGAHSRTTFLRTVGIESATTTSTAVRSLRSVGAMPSRRLTAMSSR